MEGEKKRWSLEGKTALVTGGTKGIGCAIVEELAQLGASVYTCARNEKELTIRLHEWTEAGFKFHGSVCDINNAAIGYPKPTLEVTMQDFSSLVSTNSESVFHLCQLSHPLLKASGQGSIVFISSVAGLVSFTVAGLYSSFKGALNQLTKNMAVEWADDCIRTNSVAPSLTETPMAAIAIEEGELAKRFMARTPLRRLGKTEDVSSLVAFLCMEAAAFINGQVIAVDGGFSVYGL